MIGRDELHESRSGRATASRRSSRSTSVVGRIAIRRTRKKRKKENALSEKLQPREAEIERRWWKALYSAEIREKVLLPPRQKWQLG